MKKANEDLKLVLSFINGKPDARELKRALAVKMYVPIWSLFLIWRHYHIAADDNVELKAGV